MSESMFVIALISQKGGPAKLRRPSILRLLLPNRGLPPS
jgi:hypothetical protein